MRCADECALIPPPSQAVVTVGPTLFRTEHNKLNECMEKVRLIAIGCIAACPHLGRHLSSLISHLLTFVANSKRARSLSAR